MSRILLLGDLAATGFGTVTTDLGRAMLARGEDVRFVPLNVQPVGDLPEPFRSRCRFLNHEDGWIEDPQTDEEAIKAIEHRRTIFGAWPDGWAPEAVILIGDVGSLKMSLLPDLIPKGMPAFNYVPIEGVSLPPRWALVWENMKPVAMSEFGADQIARIWPERPPVIYHGVDTEAFYPASFDRPIVFSKPSGELTVLRSKDDCKRYFGRDPKRLVMLSTNANVRRKMYGSLFRSLAPVLAAHPDIDLIYHAKIIDYGGDLLDETSKFGQLMTRMLPLNFLLNSRNYVSLDRKQLNALYNAADLYVGAGGEGFGLTYAEALACGVPALGIDFSAVPEVIGPAGVTVPVGSLIDSEFSCFWARPDEKAYGEAAEMLMTRHSRRRELGRLGPAHVAKSFSWATAAEQFAAILPVLEAVA